MKMKKIVLMIAMISLFCPKITFAEKAVLEDINYDGYVACRIDKSLYNKLDKNLYDIVIIDNDEKVLPYFINSYNYDNGFTKNIIFDKNYFIEELKADFTIKNEDNDSKIIISNSKNLKIASIEIKSEDIFMRDVYALGVYEEIYNLPENIDGDKNTIIKFNYASHVEDDLEITIFNADNEAINIDEIIIKYYADDIVFLAEKGKQYSIIYSEGIYDSKADYDISKYQDKILKEDLKSIRIKKIEKTSFDKKKIETKKKVNKKIDDKLLVNISMIVVSIVLGFIIIRYISKTNEE